MANDTSIEPRGSSDSSESLTPIKSRLIVSIKRSRPGLDAYSAALSDEHDIAPHHVLTLVSKATRFGSAKYKGGIQALASSKKPLTKEEEEVKDNASIVSRHLPQWILGWASYNSRSTSAMPLLSFQNPFESFKQPGWFEAWHGGLQWGLPEGYVEGGEHSSYRGKGRAIQESEEEADEAEVEVITPDWDQFDQQTISANVRVTWLGHATTLVQLPNGINILFDPIFVDRASPSQSVGPIRFTSPPCSVDDLPRIDIVCISHNHFDHCSSECMKKLREKEKDRGGIKIFCPLGNISFFREVGFDQQSVSEMDWWDEAEVLGDEMKKALIKLVCLPAQHGSGRSGASQNVSLWSSWLIEYKDKEDSKKTFKAYFAGDTGLRSHNTSRQHRHEFPSCPIFREISIKYGVPQLLLLPISVGSSLSYFRSWDPFPRRYSPFPRVEASMTSAIHMDSEDAAHCHQIMSLHEGDDGNSDEVKEAKAGVKGVGVTSLAVHFGTFVRNEQQTRADVRDLRNACRSRDIHFERTKEGKFDQDQGKEKGRFLVSNQGETILFPLL